MSTLDVSTEDWTLWGVCLCSPHGLKRVVWVRVPRESEAGPKAMSVPRYLGWTVAHDEYGNPLIWRE